MMKNTKNSDIRFSIIQNYSKWTSLSATRSGCPLKSREDIYSLIDLINFNQVLLGEEDITNKEFNEWHKENSIKLHDYREEMQIGWTTKIINIYLKTTVYLGHLGRPSLLNHIHPPIDNGLWNGLKVDNSKDKIIWDKVFSKKRIKDIQSYEEYENIIDGLTLIANKKNCLLIEVEQFWKGTEFTVKKQQRR